MPIQNAVAASAIVEAARLNRQVEEAKKRIEELKVIIRAEATNEAAKAGSDEQVLFESPEGVAAVCFVKDSITLIKGADPLALKGTVPESTWNLLYTQRVVLAPTFTDAFKALPGVVRKLVQKTVKSEPNEPRVTLPK